MSDLADLTITYQNGQTANNVDIGGDLIDIGENLYMADGDGFYDINFDFPPPPGTDKFWSGEESVWLISYTGDIDVHSFDFGSEGGSKGSFTSAAHVQGIDGDPDSGWIGSGDDTPPPPPVPEPTAALVFGIGAALMGTRARRQL